MDELPQPFPVLLQVNDKQAARLAVHRVAIAETAEAWRATLVAAEGRQAIDCELRFHGESYGWECQCLHDGVLAYGQRFVLREGALGEADAQRQRLVNEGWMVS